ncbi:carbonyl reductase [NADPH] 1-like [Brachionus plicatilis]|uniref:carbonyl reductase (NADPH) n=1 Tax=Brachionus plicatilis TaxID=10195 RepID=A0A3M7P6D6_BRAPC|nr:carbonyl reductase [NADPH] 1-like [Brachionus plicatilis]
MSKVAVVTGSNKGIGFAIVKGLAKQYPGIVYLTARNEQLGKKAVKDLETQGLKVAFHQLDIDNQESIDRFSNFIKERHQGLDLLVNNAAIAYKVADSTSFMEQAKNTMRINFTGTLNLCSALFPLLRPHARVVNVSSRAGMLNIVKDAEFRNKLVSDNLSVDELVGLMAHFVELARLGKNESISRSAYGMSKVGLTALTKIQQRQFDKDSRTDLVINAVCPGYVATDMSSHKGYLTPEQGAETPIYLSLLAENWTGPKGLLWAEKKVVDWADLNWSWK